MGANTTLRHGLTAETIVATLEDAEDYQAFEAAVTSDYDAESAVERELVLRLASVLWRLRRATGMETALINFMADDSKGLVGSFLRLAALPTYPLDRLSRYEYMLWRQARQLALTLESLRRRKRERRRSVFPFSFRPRGPDNSPEDFR